MRPQWFLRRLLAMTPGEVAHRAFRAARYPLDRAMMRAGVYARVPHELRAWSRPTRFYAGVDAAPAALADAGRICRGEHEVLGLGWLSLGDAPWHLEPLAKAEWPRVDSARVVAAAPPHFDARLTWELNRGHDWVTLAHAFSVTRDARYRDRLRADLASWREANPLGLGINWASPMEAAIRVHSLAWVAALANEQVGGMLHQHAVFVERHLSRFSSANNHLIVELSALCVASRVLHERPHDRALAELAEALASQCFDDGVNAEMATHYHAFVLEALLLVVHLERTWGAPQLGLEAVARRMAHYLWHLRTESGPLLEQGDSDDGKIIPLLADDHAARLVAAAHGEVLFGGEVPALPRESCAFRSSGQIILRSHRLLASIDAGPFGFGSLAAHAHCDALAVNVAFDGKPLLVDRGTYRYNGDAGARDRFRLTASHNTLQVDGREQAETAGPFLWRRRPAVTLERCDLAAVDVVTASHDGFGVTHRRTVVRIDDALVVIDEVPARATVRWHLAPGAPRERVWTSGEARLVPWTHSRRYLETTEALTLEFPVPLSEPAITVIGAAEDPRQLAARALQLRVP